jgi:hypothetical protein
MVPEMRALAEVWLAPDVQNKPVAGHFGYVDDAAK